MGEFRNKRAVEAENRVGKHADGEGLYLVVSERKNSITKSWMFRYTDAGGRRREMGLGGFPKTGLARARELAKAARETQEAGADPLKAKREARATAASDAGVTFKKCAQLYQAAFAPSWSADTLEQWNRAFEKHIYPTLGAAPVSAIDKALVLKALEPIWHKMPFTAQRLRRRIEAVLAWATVKGYRSEGVNPASWRNNLAYALPRPNDVKPRQNFARLDYKRMPEFVVALRIRTGGIAPRALEFAALTAARKHMVRFMRWRDFDEAGAAWIVPAPQMKGRKGKKREHRVPLSKQAVQLLVDWRETRPDAKPADLVFGNPDNGGKPFQHDALLDLVKRMKLGVSVTQHGFRATFRTWAGEATEFARELSEAALAHLIGDETERSYNDGDLFDRRRQLMQEWADYCYSVGADAPPANIVDFSTKKAAA